MTESKMILDALINSEKETDFKTYLFRAISTLSLNAKDATITVYVSLEYIPLFNFLYIMYPLLKIEPLTKDTPPHSIKFSVRKDKKDSLDFTSYSFSFYDKNKADIEIGLKKDQYGVFMYKIADLDKIIPNPSQFNPYAICYSNKIKSIQTFIEMIGKLYKNVKNGECDIFLPQSSYHLIPLLNFNKIKNYFNSIMIHQLDQSITSVTYDEKDSKTLRIVPIETELNQCVKYSMKHVLIDEEYKDIEKQTEQTQQIINTLVSFPDKVIWTTKNDFFEELALYTFKAKFKNLHCYQYNKELPNASLMLLEQMNQIIKLGMVIDNNTSEMTAILNILENKHLDTYHKLKKLNSLS